MTDNIFSLVKANVNILQLVKANGVDLRPVGLRWVGLCPFHVDSIPSFYVSEETQFFHCFGCGENGDAISFQAKIADVSPFEAAQDLADQFNIDVREVVKHHDEATSTVDRKSIYKLLAAVWRYWRHCFDGEDSSARDFVESRGFKLDDYDFGYAPPSGNFLLRKLRGAGFSDELLTTAGILNSHGYMFFQNRLMFAIRDQMGRITGFSGRDISGKENVPKYVNSPDVGVFNKSSQMFDLFPAWKPIKTVGAAFVVEGQFDVVAVNSLGIRNVVAASGTAFTQKHASLLSRRVGDLGKIVFCFDGDEAGKKAAMRIVGSIPGVVPKSWCVVFPNGADPADFIKFGKQAELKKLLANPQPLYQVVVNLLLQEMDLRDGNGRQAALSLVKKTFGNITSNTMLFAVKRFLFTEWGFSLEELNEFFQGKTGGEKSAPAKTNLPDGLYGKTYMREVVVSLLSLIISSRQDARDRICEAVEKIGVGQTELFEDAKNYSPSTFVEKSRGREIRHAAVDRATVFELTTTEATQQEQFLLEELLRGKELRKMQRFINQGKQLTAEDSSKMAMFDVLRRQPPNLRQVSDVWSPASTFVDETAVDEVEDYQNPEYTFWDVGEVPQLWDENVMEPQEEELGNFG